MSRHPLTPETTSNLSDKNMHKIRGNKRAGDCLRTYQHAFNLFLGLLAARSPIYGGKIRLKLPKQPPVALRPVALRL